MKTDFVYERHLNVIKCAEKIRLIVQMRTSTHRLRIETGRYGRNRVDRHERLCQVCSSNDIEDEFHFLFKCVCYNDIRRRRIKPYYWNNPSVFKLIKLLNSTSSVELINLAIYIKDAYKIRNNILNTVA